MVDTLSICSCWNGDDHCSAIQFNRFGHLNANLWTWYRFSRKSVSNCHRLWYRNDIYWAVSGFCQPWNRKMGKHCVALYRVFFELKWLCPNPCSVNEPFVNPKKGFRASMQVSMCHLFFNIFGACLWFVIPIMRKVPIGIAQFAARRTAKYRWWAVNYIIGFFFVFPVLFFLLSLASSAAVTGMIRARRPRTILGVFHFCTNVRRLPWTPW